LRQSSSPCGPVFAAAKREPVYRGLTLAAVAYLAQAAVNIAQPMTTPILFVFIGVLISREQEPDPPAISISHSCSIH
jgi:hypothetical protein